MPDNDDDLLVVRQPLYSELTVSKDSHELEAQRTEALTTLAAATKSIATFLTGGGLTDLLSGYARSQAVKDILGGLAAHDGRGALDARVLGQNALEIVAQVEAVFKKYEEKLADKEVKDPELKDAEADYLKWKKKEVPSEDPT